MSTMNNKLEIFKFTKHTREEIDKIGIYKISLKNDFKNRCYIGSALITDKRKSHRGFFVRWKSHLEELEKNKHHSQKLQNAVNKYGIENLCFEILEYLSDGLTKKEYEKIETEYIKLYKASTSGFNICHIAGTSKGLKKSLKQRLKNSIAKSKGKIYQYSKEGLFLKEYDSLLEIKFDYPDINKNSMLSGLKNVNRPYYRNFYWFREYKGDKIDVSIYKREIKSSYRNIHQYDLDGNLIKIWDSLKDLEKAGFLQTWNISSCIRGLKKTAYSFYWSNGFISKDMIVKPTHTYFINRPFKEQIKRQKKVYQYNLVGDFVKEWTSIKKAEEALGINNISANLRKLRNSAGGFQWSFIKYDRLKPHYCPEKAIDSKKEFKVFQYSLDGTFLKEWTGAKEASKTLNINRECIRLSCVGKNKTGGGYIWKYEKEHLLNN